MVRGNIKLGALGEGRLQVERSKLVQILAEARRILEDDLISLTTEERAVPEVVLRPLSSEHGLLVWPGSTAYTAGLMQLLQLQPSVYYDSI